MSKQLKRRAQRSASEWSQLIDNWRQSEMTPASFAARHGVGLSSLYSWAAKLKRGTVTCEQKPRGFVAVKVVEEVRATPSFGGCMELVARSGRMIRISGRVDTDALAQVLRVAEQC